MPLTKTCLQIALVFYAMCKKYFMFFILKFTKIQNLKKVLKNGHAKCVANKPKKCILLNKMA